VVGFPGETEADFQYLLDWLDEAQLDRVGAFRFEPVEGAAANDLPGAVPEEVKEERYARLMEKTEAISAGKLAAKVGRTCPSSSTKWASLTRTAISAQPDAARPMRPRSTATCLLRNVPCGLPPGDCAGLIEDADAHDLYGSIAENELASQPR
jgi:ribosomal protein S12 methylthiotransferase